MTDTLTRLVGPVALAAMATTVYTVPGGKILTLRSLHVTNETGTLRTFRLSIGVDGAGTRLFFDVPVDAGDPGFDWTGSVILAAGEVIQAYADTGAALTLVISGVLTT